MEYSIVYSSRTGNTKLLAEKVRELLLLREDADLYFGEPSHEGAEAEMIFAGFWTDQGDCDETMAFFLKNLQNKKVFLFGTAGFGGSREYYDRILSKVRSHLEVTNVVTGAWMCQGKMPLSVKGRYEAMLQDKADESIKKMIANFDSASSHPDAEDIKEFLTVVKSVINEGIG